jgi:hypothetical protein
MKYSWLAETARFGSARRSKVAQTSVFELCGTWLGGREEPRT